MSLSNRSKAIVDVFVYENVDGANVSIFLKRERETLRNLARKMCHWKSGGVVVLTN